jgi:hypothetical protein
MNQNFTKELMAIGILSYREQERLWQIAKRCASTTGVPMAGAGALMGMQIGTVTVPGIGTVAGPVAGALAGLFAGTFSCTLLNYSMRRELKKLANGE